MTYNNWPEWRHVTKLDPDKNNTYKLIEKVCASGTDAVLIGGTQGITKEKVGALLNTVKNVAPDSLTVAVEVSDPEALILGADKYFVPVVLNTCDIEWLFGAHQQAFSELDLYLNLVPIEQLVVPEGYVILNPDCAAAKKAKVKHDLNKVELLSMVRVAKYIFNMPLIYLEYSGKLGDLACVEEVKRAIGTTRLFYGGGITTPEQAELYGKYADTVVVGNMVYTNQDILQDIVQAVKTVTSKW